MASVTRLVRGISIHAPREGSDRRRDIVDPAGEVISIHAPREGSDELWRQSQDLFEGFLSTLPARGATQQVVQDQRLGGISIHAPREGSDREELRIIRDTCGISIHAPREGSDSSDIARHTL